MKYLSMFSGIGGFELGIMNSEYGSQFECVGYMEIDKYAESIYRRNFPDHVGYGDATRIKPDELPDFDFLVGGFPCQAFSIAGRQRGFDDTRGTLFFEIARILKEKKPRYLLLENVRGLLSHDKGRTFQVILGVLSDLGYEVQWEVLNTKNHGIPQNRERVFIKGYLGGQCGREVLRFGESSEETSQLTPKILNNHKVTHQGGRLYSVDGLSITLNSSGNNGWYQLDKCYSSNQAHRGENDGEFSYYINSDPHNIPLVRYKKVDKVWGSTQKNCSQTDGDITSTLTASMGQGGGHVPMMKIKEVGNISPNGHGGGKVVSPDGISPTLLCGNYKAPIKFLDDEFHIRKLTPTECERLQGFPDGWTKYGVDGELISDTQRYKCLGNAVTTNVISYVIDQMFKNI